MFIINKLLPETIRGISQRQFYAIVQATRCVYAYTQRVRALHLGEPIGTDVW